MRAPNNFPGAYLVPFRAQHKSPRRREKDLYTTRETKWMRQTGGEPEERRL